MSSGTLSTKLAFQFLHPSPTKLDWAAIIWWPCIPPSHLFVFWCLMLSKLPTDDNLQMRGCTLVSICVLCYRQVETSFHLFMSCDFAVAIWRWLGLKLNRIISLISIASLLECIPVRCSLQVRDDFVFAIVQALHYIWLARIVVWFISTAVSFHAVHLPKKCW